MRRKITKLLMRLQSAWRINLKNTFGNSITMTLFGESHGKAVGVVIDGLAPGLDTDTDKITKMLERRAPQNDESGRHEKDNFEILSGVFNGKTTGTPLAIVIPNDDVRSCDYSYGMARPSHADYAAFCKYHGYEDYRGGGHFSGRVTAAIAVAGAIFVPALEKLGISLESRILTCGGENITEAQCMADWLIEHGIDESRIYLEEQATNTRENVEFSQEILQSIGIDTTDNVAVVTSNYHLYRASLYWGVPWMVPVAAKMPAFYWPLTLNYYIREVFAVAKLLVFGG